MQSGRYLSWFLGALAFWVGAVMVTNFVVDPLQFFRPARYPPLWSYEQRHQSAAIARTMPFDAAVTGNSSMGTIRAQGMSDALGMRVEHLGINGSTLFEQRRILTLALSRKRLRAIVWGVSDFALTAPPPADAVRSDLTADPYYLYSANPLLWSRYLFDLSSIGSSLTILGTRAMRFPGYRRIDPATLTAPPYTWVYGPESLQRYLNGFRASCRARRSTVPSSVFERAPGPWPDYVEQRMRSIHDLARDNPATRFHIVFPPVHAALYRELILCDRGGVERLYVHSRMMEHLSGLTNVSIHDFRAAPVSFDDGSFYDGVHFSWDASQRLAEDVAAGRWLVPAADFQRVTRNAVDAIRRYVCEQTPGVNCAGD